MKSRQTIWLLPLLLLLLTACSDNLTPSEVSQHYLEAVRDGNYGNAYEVLTADSQLKISRSDFGDRLARAKQDTGIVRTEILKVNRDSTIVGKRASVTYQLEITLQSGQKLSLFEAMVLLQQDNGWRVIWPPQ
ncbi:MAG: DUF4878 domain-containing protein [Chloroflexi bacterium]|uniref:DUF4878 domain-containing protein n=1 Tax=Candidatus Chlorohelix allophototropha TaxID=3003348 RepID=A0A8T7M357_9CHLR|nr:DUF4878 domain-containing protein [Chloroflexota bacterium]WJW67247.1 DUF4878 domain-containing protein [Chloroflexota bacterium L227-S17]